LLEGQVIHMARASTTSQTASAWTSLAALAVTLGLLAGCASSPAPSADNRGTVQTASTGRTAVQPSRLPPARLEATPAGLLNERAVRVALLAPFSSPSEAVRQEAQALQAAAELALFEHGDGTVILLPKDSGTTATDAAEATRKALENGADFIIGPMFASGVEAVAGPARRANVPVFSLSTDTSQAGNGVYALTFLPEDDARRITSFAMARGVTRFVVIAPEGDYGDRVARAVTEVTSASSVTAPRVVRYGTAATAAASVNAAAREAATAAAGGGRYQTGIVIAERGARLRTITSVLANNGASPSRVRYLGVGGWNSPATVADPRMLGAWFATPDLQGRSAFETRYSGTFSQTPTRLAGMGYDATALIANLVRSGDRSRITPTVLAGSEGFMGVDGLFRFRNGVVERALAVYEIGPDGVRMADPAPARW
jgi:branched-chain amino acid transport system substrate-binding protein